MHSQALRMSNILCPFSASLPLGEVGKEAHSGKMRCGQCFLSMRHTKWNRACVKAKHCSEGRSGLCRPPALLGDTALHWARPHLYNIWHYTFATSLCTCFLTSVHNVTGSIPPPPDKRILSFTEAHCHGCRFLLLVSGVMSICTALLETCCCPCSTGRELSSLPSAMTNAASTLHIFLRLFSPRREYPTCHRARMHLVLPQDILATLISFIFSDLFLGVLRTSESLMTMWEKTLQCSVHICGLSPVLHSSSVRCSSAFDLL